MLFLPANESVRRIMTDAGLHTLVVGFRDAVLASSAFASYLKHTL